MGKLLAVLAMGMVLSGCTSLTHNADQAAYHASAVMMASSFVCQGEHVYVEEAEDQTLYLTRDGHRHVLKPVLSDDLLRYVSQDGQLVWTPQQAQGVLQRGQQMMSCRQLSDDLSFTAHGNEPFWSVTVDHQQAVVEGIDLPAQTLPLSVTATSGLIKSYRSEDQSLIMTLTTQLCQDDMSGMYYPLQADVQYQDKTWRGCAGDAHYVLAGKWQVKMLNQQPVVPGTVLDVTFNDDVISGHAGCHTFSGTYALSGEAMSVSDLASSAQFCRAGSVRQEAQFLTLLKQVNQFSFKGETILFYTEDQQIIQAVRDER